MPRCSTSKAAEVPCSGRRSALFLATLECYFALGYSVRTTGPSHDVPRHDPLRADRPATRRVTAATTLFTGDTWRIGRDPVPVIVLTYQRAVALPGDLRRCLPVINELETSLDKPVDQ